MNDQSFIDTEVWVPVHTLPGLSQCIEYYVNRKGQVKSTKSSTDRLLKPKCNRQGYLIVTLTQRLGKGKPLSIAVHKLVALAFLPPPPTPYGRLKGCTTIKHLDNDRSNCRIENLKWTTTLAETGH